MTTQTTPASGGARIAVQRFGTFLSGMIMPNIAAFIAWGFITALFIKDGFLPVPELGGFPSADGTEHTGLVGPMITYLLPLLIANTAGRMVYDTRGGVVATIATVGVIVGSDIPMFLGAMIMGPLAAWLMKRVDKIWDGKIRAGFEMLVNNFSAGILGMLLAIVGFFAFGPAFSAVSKWLELAVDWLYGLGLLPLLSIIVEPAKVLFLNNAINHGVFTPIGTQQALETGKSILFLVEANPGPGLGILLAFSIFGVGMARASAPGAAIIHFFGGIHEIYFPYVLMKPMMIIAAIAGGATGVATNALFGSGLRAPAAPGSIIAVLAQTASDSYVGVILSVVLSTLVSFLIAAVILRASRKRDLAAEGAGDLSEAIAQTQANKGKESSVLGGLAGSATAASATGAAPTAVAVAEADVASAPISTIIFACDAGMGSSAMGATVLRNKLKSAGITGVEVTNRAIASLNPGDAQLVVTHRDLTERARTRIPEALHVSVENFMASPRYDDVINLVGRSSADQA